MNFKTTIVLLVLLVAIGVYFAVGHFHGGEPAADTTTKVVGKIVDIDAGTVKSVSVTYADGKKLVVERAGAGWKMTQPVAANADSMSVEALVTSVTGLQSHGQMPAEQIASVGLDHPKLTIDVTSIDGKTATVKVGDKSKISDDLYVMLDGKTQPEIVSSGAYEQLSKAAETYRSKKLIDASSDQIQSLTLTQGGQNIHLEKRGNSWTITQPTEIPAEESEVSSLLMGLTDLNATDFVANPAAPAAYGLATPQATVQFTTGAPTTAPAASQPAPTTVVFGRFDSVLQKSVYAQVNGGPIVTVPASSEATFTKTVLDLRDRKVIDIDPAAVEKISLKRNRIATTQPTSRPAEEAEFALTRRPQTLTMGPTLPSTQPATTQATTQATTEPSTQPASKWTLDGGGDATDASVDALLTALHPLKAEKYVAGGPTTQPADDYVLTIHTGPSAGHGATDYTLHLRGATAPTPVTGEYNGVSFETDRAILEKLDANYKAGK